AGLAPDPTQDQQLGCLSAATAARRPDHDDCSCHLGRLPPRTRGFRCFVPVRPCWHRSSGDPSMTSQFFRYLLTFVLAFGLASSVHAEMRNPNHTATWWDEHDPGWG